MPTLTLKQQWLIGGLLLLAMIATRSHLVSHVHDASWAVFFLAGIYLGGLTAFAGLMLAAVAIDYAAISFGGVSAFCVSAAYAALVPAYATLFFAGRWFATHHSDHRNALLTLVPALLGGVVLCELISSGSFYFLSGRFSETSIASFAAQEAIYLPHVLSVTGLYVAIAALVHVAVRSTLTAGKLSA